MTEQPAATKPKISAFELEANKFIQCATSMLVNGVRSSMPAVATAPLMVKLSSALGVALGQVLSIGHLGDILPLRAECIKAFSEGIRAVKIQPPPEQPKRHLNG